MAHVNKIEDKIRSLGGEISKTDKWGTRKLASMLRKHPKLQQAFYVLIFFQSATAVPASLNAYLKINEEIARYAVIRGGEEAPAEIAGTPIAEPSEAEAVEVGEIKGEPDAEESSGQS